MAQGKLNPLALLAVVALALLAGCGGNDGTTGTQRVEIGGETFTLELAMTGDAREQGLSDRDFIAPDGGMLFVFPRERELQFVMRRCLVPIDILFLGPSGKVIAAHAMEVEPYERTDKDLKKYGSNGRSPIAIELAGGTIERLGVEVGDQIELPILELKRRAE
ncbi:MAG: DUF192 domain-containing protein [Planctomycetota bacterium]